MGPLSADTVVQHRDRALIVVLFLTASREGAAITLRIRHIDLVNSCVHFDAVTVNTKFGKSSTTAFFPFGSVVVQIIRDWIADSKQIICSRTAICCFRRPKLVSARRGGLRSWEFPTNRGPVPHLRPQSSNTPSSMQVFRHVRRTGCGPPWRSWRRIIAGRQRITGHGRRIWAMRTCGRHSAPTDPLRRLDRWRCPRGSARAGH